MGWFVAPSLLRFRDQINAAHPNRDKASDGTIGDPSHQARKSSHNPAWHLSGRMKGVVLGIDFDSDGAPGELTDVVKDVLDAARGDKRVWYVIWNGTIWSRTTNWEARAYNGSNPHSTHVHVSLREREDAAFSKGDWVEDRNTKVRWRPLPIRLDLIRDWFRTFVTDPNRTVIGPKVHIKRVQRALNRAPGDVDRIKVDGYLGPSTAQAWRAWERRENVGVRGRPGVPDKRSLNRLLAPDFKIADPPRDS